MKTTFDLYEKSSIQSISCNCHMGLDQTKLSLDCHCHRSFSNCLDSNWLCSQAELGTIHLQLEKPLHQEVKWTWAAASPRRCQWRRTRLSRLGLMLDSTNWDMGNKEMWRFRSCEELFFCSIALVHKRVGARTSCSPVLLDLEQYLTSY